MASFFARLGSEWRRGHTFDVWDPSAGTWREAREIWAFGSGAWRSIYRRPFINGASVEVTPGDPFPVYAVTIPIGGFSFVSADWVVRLNGVDATGGTVTAAGTVFSGLLGTAGIDTLDVQLFNPLGRLLDSQVLF
jgi:hypothetical protein